MSSVFLSQEAAIWRFVAKVRQSQSRWRFSMGSLLATVLKLLVLFGAAMILASCLMPDGYELDVDLKYDGAYAITYEGDLIFVPTYADSERRIVRRTAPGISDIEALLRQEKGFRSVKALGNSRFRVSYYWSDRVRSEPYIFVGEPAEIFRIARLKDGSIALTGASLPKKDRNDLRTLGMRSKGLLRVHVNGSVVATNSPSWFGLYTGTYRWNVDAFAGDRPIIVVAAPSG